MSASAVLTGLDLLIQLIDRTSAASAVIKQARAEGRDVSASDLESIRAQFGEHIQALDDAIARAKAEGR